MKEIIDNFNSQMQKYYKRNFVLHVLNGVSYGIGLCFANFHTILPAFIATLTDSTILIGLIPFIYAFGIALPQIFSAYIAESAKFKKRRIIAVGLPERFAWLFIGLATLIFARKNPALTLLIFFILFTIHVLTCGFNMPVWMDFVSKTIPNRWRGRFWGTSGLTTGILSIGIGLIVARIFEKYAFPVNYSILFLALFIFSFISIIFFAMIKEGEFPIVREHMAFKNYFRNIKSILKTNKNYVLFLISYLLGNSAVFVSAFYTAYALKTFNPEKSVIATFMTLLVFCRAFSIFILGHLGDYKGHVIALRIAFVAGIIGIFAAAFSTSIHYFYVSFVMHGIFIGGVFASGYNAVIEFCPPQERPTYISLTSVSAGPIPGVLAVLTGALLQYSIISYKSMFLFFGITATIGLLILLLKVTEPRESITGQQL